MTFKQLFILRIRELKVLLLLIAAYVVSFCRRDRQLWLIAERGTDARDNGFWLFRYIKEKQPGIRVKYIVSRNSPDLNKLADYCDCLVETGSFQHYVLLWRAECLISTHIQGFTPFPDLFASINQKVGIWKNKKVVFLQHGITKDLLPQLFYTNTRLDLFICGAEPEYRFVCREFGYSDDKVAYTGLCRYDGLNDYRVKDPKILKKVNISKFIPDCFVIPVFKHFFRKPDYRLYFTRITKFSHNSIHFGRLGFRIKL